jgi:recombination protein RecT
LKSSPELAQCSKESLIAAVVQTVQLGLTPGNIGHCHYIPFNSKTGKQAQFIIGYKGIVELVNRCGKATLLSTEIVRDGDLFEYELGLNPVLKHIPAWDGKEMPIKGVYCVAKNLVANEKVFVYMDKSEIDKIKSSSKAAGSEYSPWNKWYEEMAKKTVIKRICKLLPLSVDEQQKVATDETVKTELSPDMSTVKDQAVWDGDTIDTPAQDPGDAGAPQPADKPVNEAGQDPNADAAGQPNPGDQPDQDRSKFISEKQVKRLFAIAKSAGWSGDQVKDYIKEIHEIDSRNDIPWGAKYDEICKFIEDNPHNDSA